ncbi:MAG: L-2-amino-thiazoline-4-carboxylic acid hydrolase [Oscillospiraceae bacterium]|jgi:hypothetical protein|nr:L-2-amino-thiazoline-4-carboxylic acid hydrolase [Oscillospiraceae bacterium]
MPEIKNEPRTRKNPLITALREQMEHRALWLYLLTDEAKKAGIDPAAFAPSAIARNGIFSGNNLLKKAGTDSLKGLQKATFHYFARLIFDMEILDCTDDRLDIDFHYCPLLEAWQKQGCDAETCGKLCDWAMCGDHEIAKQFGALLHLESAIAHGSDACRLRFRKESAKVSDLTDQ